MLTRSAVPSLSLMFLLAACADAASGGSGPSEPDVGFDIGIADVPVDRDGSGDGEVTPDVVDEGSSDAATPGETGDPCLSETDCATGVCLDLLTGDEQPGVCSDYCNDDDDCLDGYECLTFVNSGDDFQRVCVPVDLCFDGDGDTFGQGPGCRGPDCDDSNEFVNLLADEVCDGIDNNCDEAIDENPVGIGTPCETGFPGACGMGLTECITGLSYCTPAPPTDEVCDGIDNDCDGAVDEEATDPPTWYLDADLDLFGDETVTAVGCTAPEGYVAAAGDCDDTNASIRPGAGEVCNGVDDTCDGNVDELPAVGTIALYPDADGDGYGTSSAPINACAGPEGYAATGGDCNDGNGAINPAAIELCNAIDDDCDGSTDEGVTPRWYQDLDGDRAGNPAVFVDACTVPAGYLADAGDCNDSTAYIGPGAVEICDGFDNNCNGGTDESGCRGGCAGRTFEGRGYLFCWGDGNQLSWDAAAGQCGANGMSLAAINTASENTFIFDTANALMPTNWDDLWFGGRRNGGNEWTWPNGTVFAQVNGTAAPGAFTDWKPGEPNSTSEDCAEMEDYRTSGRLWNDVPCGQGHEFVCEWN